MPFLPDSQPEPDALILDSTRGWIDRAFGYMGLKELSS